MTKTLLRLRPKCSTDSPVASSEIFPNHNQFVLPKILSYLPLDWRGISENLGINIDKNDLGRLEFCINKYFYSDQTGIFQKSYGVKTRNLYDLGSVSINQINDADLVIDSYGFAFSCFDLRKLDKAAPHPYVNCSSIQETQVAATQANRSRMTLSEYFESVMQNESSLTNSSQAELISVSEIDNYEILESLFETEINHNFFTPVLITIYRSKREHLDYTVTLLYYILAIIDNYGLMYRSLLITNYSIASDKYLDFLRNYIKFFKDLKSNSSVEKCHYVSVIVFKVLQYRYQQLQDSQVLFDLVKSYVPKEQQTELYWSIVLDRLNYLHGKATNKISLINISIDNIFSNTEFDQYYYTLLVYLHTKYMQLPLRQDQNKRSSLLEHYKPLDNYNYLDVIQYFTELADIVANIGNSNQSEHLHHDGMKYFKSMIKRYYLNDSYITISRNGLVSD